ARRALNWAWHWARRPGLPGRLSARLLLLGARPAPVLEHFDPFLGL
ncbi:hypothetical protein L195_g062534, partial [Trifolium pratense]